MTHRVALIPFDLVCRNNNSRTNIAVDSSQRLVVTWIGDDRDVLTVRSCLKGIEANEGRHDGQGVSIASVVGYSRLNIKEIETTARLTACRFHQSRTVDIHDGQEQMRSIQGPDTEAQDMRLQIIKSSLQHTAGPYKSATIGLMHRSRVSQNRGI
jgi:hypothetical protein